MSPAPDLSRRADLIESMDSITDYAYYRSCITGLARIDRIILSQRPTFRFLARLHLALLRSGRPVRPVHIVDVGCGDGDLLRRIHRWAVRRRLPVVLTGIDLNAFAARAAAEATAPEIPVRWLTADALTWKPDLPIDIILSCHLTHHLADRDLVAFLGWMESVARLGWFINDIHRQRKAYAIFDALSRVLRFNDVLRDDGLISIRRSFVPEDWRRLCDAAGLDLDQVSIERDWPFRICVSRLK